MLIQTILSQDNSVILYRKELNQLTGSVTATLFLSQVIYWWYKNGRKPFYKFRTICKHIDYKEGDSWCEELGFSEKELDYAIAAVCEKTNNTRKDAKESLKQNLVKPYVISHTNIDRKTYYTLNETLLEKDLKELYIRLHNLQSSDYVIPETEITKHTKGRLDLYTENTTENTNNSFASQQNPNFSLPSRQNEKKEPPTPQSPPPPFAEATKNFKEWFCETFYPQYHEGLKYSFKAARDGKHLKNIVKQMVAQIKSKGKEATDENVFKFLVKCLENFDKADFAWVGEINLGLVDSQFNKFILSAKKVIDGQNKPQTAPLKPSSTMYGDKRDKEEIERENILNDKSLTKEQKQQKLYELSKRK